MNGQYVIGVDGGGTKTDCALLTRDGTLVDFIRWGTTSHEFLDGGMAEMRQELGALIQLILRRNAIRPDDICSGVFGMAGVDTPWQKRRVEEVLLEQGISCSIVCNDGYLGIKGGTATGRGATIINGTGCSLTGIGADGEMMQLGGQSVVMDDIAGGNVVGRNIVRLVFADIVLHERPTLLSALLASALGMERPDPKHLMDVLVEKVGNREMAIKHLAPLMFEAAHRQDPVAKEYLEQMGRNLARYLSALMEWLHLADSPPVEVVLIGSGFLRAVDRTHIRTMKQTIWDRFGENSVRFSPLRVRPVCGASLWALEEVGWRPPAKETRSSFLKRLEAEICATEAAHEEPGHPSGASTSVLVRVPFGMPTVG